MSDLTPGGEASLKGLIAAAVADLQRLIRAQVQLAKLELQQTGREAAKTSILLVGALMIGGTAGLFLLVTIAYVIAIWLPIWAGFGIVTLTLFIITAVLGLLGKKESAKIKGPERTIAQIEQTKAMLARGATAPEVGTVSEVAPEGPGT